MVYAGLRKAKTIVFFRHLGLFSGRQPVKIFKTLNDRQSGIFNKFHKSKKSSHK